MTQTNIRYFYLFEDRENYTLFSVTFQCVNCGCH